MEIHTKTKTNGMLFRDLIGGEGFQAAGETNIYIKSIGGHTNGTNLANGYNRTFLDKDLVIKLSLKVVEV